jgi:hypothetical protein
MNIVNVVYVAWQVHSRRLLKNQCCIDADNSKNGQAHPPCNVHNVHNVHRRNWVLRTYRRGIWCRACVRCVY